MKHLKVTSVVLTVAMCMSMIAPVSVLADETAAPSETQTEETVKPEPKETEKPAPKETEKPKPSETEKQKSEETVKQEPEETEKSKPAETSKEETAETEKQTPSETSEEEPAETKVQEPSETKPETPSETEKQEPEATDAQETSETEEQIPEATEKPIQESEAKKEAKDASGSCGQVSWTLSGDTLTISGSGTMTISGGFAPWYNYRASIKKVVVSNGVTKVCSNAFESLENLTTATIANSVTSIGTMAFAYCSSLSSVTLPSGLTSISGNLFYNCKSLKSITIPSTVTTIGGRAFSGCSLTGVSIPSGVTEIGPSAFYGCPLTSVTIPSGIKVIEDYTFYGAKFTSISFPSGLTEIGQYAFARCTELTSVTIPSNVDYVLASAFSNCTKLKTVKINCARLSSIDGNLFLNCSALTSVTIPENVETISNSSFEGCSSLTSIELPEGIYSIGQSAFKGCKKLTTINIPEGVKNYSDSIFEGCTSLTSIAITPEATRIGHSAFRNCTALKSIEIPSTMKNVWTNAFNGCSSLTNVYFNGTETKWNNIEIASGNDPLLNATLHPSDITNFGGANGTCGNGLSWTLSSSGVLTITGSGAMDNFDKSTYGEYKFYSAPWNQYKTKITKVVLPSGLTSIGNGAFNGCSQLTSISIPSTVKSIGRDAFTNTKISSITIPSGVTKIVDSAFEGCTNLTTVSIPSTVTSIGANAFAGTGIKSVSIPSSVKTIGNNAFKNCSSLTGVTLNNGLTDIGDFAFTDCSSLTSISLPGTLKNIGNSAFRRSGITSLTIPGSVEDMSYFAFADCTSLKTVEISDGVYSIGSNAFNGCKNLESVTIPVSVGEIGDYAFSGCTKLTTVYYAGTQNNWNNISFNGSGHDQLLNNATIYYNSSGVTLYSVKVTNITGEGTVSLSKTSAEAGTVITVTATPAAGYYLVSIAVDGTNITGNTFKMPEHNAEVEVRFGQSKFNVTVNYTTGGTAYSVFKTAGVGDTITVKYTPDTGYELGSITVNGEEITGNKFTMPACDVTVLVTFTQGHQYAVNVSVPNGGGTATATPSKAVAGTTVTINPTPSKGYELDTIKVDGKAISGKTFTMPSSDVDVTVSFKKSVYKINLNVGTGGSATVSKTSANYGDKITVTATPATGYSLDYIKVGTTELSSNTFTMSAEDVTVTVAFKKEQYTITATVDGEGGSVSTNVTKAGAGDTITITATPSKGYSVDTIKVNNKAISGTTFTMTAQNTTVVVTFKKASYKITVSKPVNGSATASQEYANYGDKITITATPATGYVLDTITANGTVLTSNTFSMSAADVTVEVTFKKATYTISAVIGEGGSATIKPTKAQYGDTVTVTATPSKGYALDTIKVNGKAISGDTFTMPAQNTEVDISFKKLTYKINVAKPVNGSVSVSATTATYGEKITVTATPATGYAVNTIKVNDTTLTGNTFNMSAADVTVEVTFKKVQYTVTVKYSAGGTATADVAKAGYGDMVSLTFKPNTGYEVEYVTVNDENSEQVFTMPAENVTVYVKFKKIDYTITVGRVTNGTASVDKEVANYGDKVTVTATPATGYTLDVIKVNGTPITGNTFTMENRWTTVEVFFKLKDYKVNLKTGTGGTATVNKTTANMGDSISVTFVSDPGYQLDKITVNGNPSSSAFLMGASDVDVMVTFKKITYKISLTVGSNGTAKLSQTTAVVDDEITVETTPAENYYAIIKVGDDVIVGNTFKMPPMNVTVKVTFDKVKPLDVGETATVGNGEYTVTAAAPENGTGTVRLDKINDDGSKAVKVPDTVDIKGVTYRVTAIGNNAMAGNPTMTSLYIGSYVTVIGSKACYGCKALVKVSGGLRLKTIGNIAFGGCTKLSTFVITSAVLAKISPYTFYADKSLKTIYVNKTTKLSKAGVKKSLKSSSVKTVKVKKSKVKKYKKIFKKKNCGRKVKVKK